MSTFVTAYEAIELGLYGNGDILMRDKGLMVKMAKYVYDDMKLTVLKQAQRDYFTIDKRTNSITLPCTKTMISSVSVRDRCGHFYPVWRNESITSDIVDVSAARDCSCEYKCGYKLCNTIKGYVSVQETKTDSLPNGDPISFVCTDRKVVQGGWLIAQTQYPQRVYMSGVWTDTILYTENTQICRVEVDHNGCVCDTEENIDCIFDNCCSDGGIPFGGTADTPPAPNIDTWRYYCNSKLDWFSVQCGNDRVCHNPFGMIYNISEEGNRLIFPAHFGFDKVLVRFYATVPTNQIKIPLIAVDTFVLGCKWWAVRWNDNKQALAEKYKHDYAQSKWGLLGELNRRTIQEYRMLLTPPVYVPSYTNNYFYNISNWGSV
jgi:hypothetical protein